MWVANVGDSRAIVIQEHEGKLMARPLSSDQTPYRKVRLASLPRVMSVVFVVFAAVLVSVVVVVLFLAGVGGGGGGGAPTFVDGGGGLVVLAVLVLVGFYFVVFYKLGSFVFLKM